MKKLLTIFMLILATTLITACSYPPSSGDVGMVTGGVLGGYAGSALTGGSTAGTIAGAVGGGFIGREIAE